MSLTLPDLGEVAEDRLLGGKVRLLQPRAGYRAATDPVLLAASVPARADDSVLDLGCGAGAASLCLAARVPVALTGIEIQPDYAELATRNAALNGVAMELYRGDIAHPPPALRAQVFDHVILNPPFYPAGAAVVSPVAAKDQAHRETADLAVWMAAAMARLRPRGWLTVIHRTTRLAEILAGLTGAGDIAIKPLAARPGREAKRVILRARKDVRSPLRLCAPLILHDGAAHLADGEDFSAEARGILRDGAPILF